VENGSQLLEYLNNKNEPKIERNNVTFSIPANIKRNQQGHLCITLEKAGIYRRKQRYTVNEIPDLGATVSPEVEVARWLLLRGADPSDQMAVRYPKGQGVPLELEFQGKPDILLMNPHVTTLAGAAHLYDISSHGHGDSLPRAAPDQAGDRKGLVSGGWCLPGLGGCSPAGTRPDSLCPAARCDRRPAFHHFSISAEPFGPIQQACFGPCVALCEPRRTGNREVSIHEGEQTTANRSINATLD
jgi:hypothetical protein